MENKTKWIKLWVHKHHDSILKLNKEEAGTIFQNIIKYSSGEPIDEMSPLCDFIFGYIRQDIDSCIKTYENKVNIARENGKNGGRPPKNKQTEIKENINLTHKYGEYKNVLLSDEELQKLKRDFPESMISNKIEALSGYMESTGKSYKSHYATLRNWINKDMKKGGEEGVSEDRGKVFDVEDFL